MEKALDSEVFMNEAPFRKKGNEYLFTLETFKKLLSPKNYISFHNGGFTSTGPMLLATLQERILRGVYLKRVFIDKQLLETKSITLYEQQQDGKGDNDRTTRRTNNTQESVDPTTTMPIGGDLLVGGPPSQQQIDRNLANSRGDDCCLNDTKKKYSHHFCKCVFNKCRFYL